MLSAGYVVCGGGGLPRAWSVGYVGVRYKRIDIIAILFQELCTCSSTFEYREVNSEGQMCQTPVFREVLELRNETSRSLIFTY